MKQSTKLKWGLMTLVLVAGAIGGVFLVRTTFQPVEQEAAPVVMEQEVAMQEFQLYFGSSKGTHLVAESRSLPACEAENTCVTRVFNELIAGPDNPDLLPVLPAEAQVVQVQQEAGVVLVDMSKEFFTRHPGGTLSELLTVYSLVNTLAENFPHLRQIRLLQEGEPQDTLKGHVSLKLPVVADFRFSDPPLGEVTPEVVAPGE